jgi:hypothetical protein
MYKIIILFILILLRFETYAQSNEVTLGTSAINPRGAAIIDCSDPHGVNMKVALWGAVKVPGYYIIPSYTNIRDLISYAGGPLEVSKIEAIRIIRMKEDSSQIVIRCNMGDYVDEKDTSTVKMPILLKPGDTVIIPAGEPKMFLRDYLLYGSTILSILVSISLLILYNHK